MSLLTFLGAGLVALLRQGISMWSTAERRGLVYDQARALLDQLAVDLRSTAVRTHRGDDNAWIRLVCDRDAAGFQRLRFVRAISGETEDPILRNGGRHVLLCEPRVYDGRDDLAEAEGGLLGAPGGLMEVFYGRDPRAGSHVLWRAVRTPIGGGDSLFNDDAVEPPTGAPGPRNEMPAAGSPFGCPARPVADGVLFLGFSFWGPTTNTWDPVVVPLSRPGPGQRSGPLFWWDSTRALLDLPSGPEEFSFRRRELSLNDPTDDIFPEMVEVTVVLGDARRSLGPRLAAAIEKSTLRFTLTHDIRLPDSARDRFLLVDDEWIAVESIEGRQVVVAPDGRGVRDTVARRHDRGSRVDLGIPFRRVVAIPGHRGEPRELEASDRERRLIR